MFCDCVRRAPGALPRFCVPLALAGMLVAPFCASGANAGAKPRCGGRDMMAELAVTQPDVHARILSEALAFPNTEAVLWRVDREGLAPSWLFGTVHLSDTRVTTLPPATAKALESARAVALEVSDVSATASAAVIAANAALMIYADGRHLDKVLAPAEFAKVKALLEPTGIPGEAAADFRPWIVSLLLSVSACERRAMEAGGLVLDMRIAERARARGLPLVGLETIESQLKAMAETPDDQQVTELRAMLKYADRADDLMETVMQLYLNRRIGAAWPFQMALARAAGIDPEPLVAVHKELIGRRNQGMRQASLPLLAKGGAFIAVGALHLPGDDGLVALLRQDGFTVSAIE